MHDRTPWTRGRTGDFQLPTRSGKLKTYNNLTEFTRPCMTCGQSFSIHVTGKIAAGEADSNSFGLKNCEEHRRARTTDDTLRMSNNVMKQELDGLYSRVQEQFAEIQQLKARLALYELQPAMEAHANGTTGHSSADAAELTKPEPPSFTHDAAVPLTSKMPWE